MPPSIVKLAGSFLVKPVHVEVAPQATTVELVEQTIMFVERADKRRLLASLLKERGVGRTIVFTRTKHGANRLAGQLDKAGLRCAAIHGNKSQGARKRALDGFRSGAVPVLIATDIAARGIDVDDVTHVFNFDLPNIPESYVHRIGRTARAGRSGIAISFCDPTEGEYLRDIEKMIGIELLVADEHQWHSDAAEREADRAARNPGHKTKKKKPSGASRGRNRGGGGGGGGRGRGGQRPKQRRPSRRGENKASDSDANRQVRAGVNHLEASRQRNHRAPGASRPSQPSQTRRRTSGYSISHLLPSASIRFSSKQSGFVLHGEVPWL